MPAERGECGGWEALIPSNAKKITKGKRIFEFTDTRMHKDSVDTTNKLVYRPMYPGYQERKKHPQGLCVPCCFKMPAKTVDKEGNIWEEVKVGRKKMFKLIMFIPKQVLPMKKTSPKPDMPAR